MMAGFGKLFIITGICFVVIGLALLFGDRIPFLGRLPGDIYVKKERFSLYFPVTTSIVISIIITVILSIFRK